MTRIQDGVERIKNFVKKKLDRRRTKKELKKAKKVREYFDQQYPFSQNSAVLNSAIQIYDVVTIKQDFPEKGLYKGYLCTVENVSVDPTSGETVLFVLYDSQEELAGINNVVPESAVQKYWDSEKKTLVTISDTQENVETSVAAVDQEGPAETSDQTSADKDNTVNVDEALKEFRKLYPNE